MMTIMLIIIFMTVINTYQAHDENIEEAKLKATGCSWECWTPVLALQDVRVEPKEVEPDTDLIIEVIFLQGDWKQPSY